MWEQQGRADKNLLVQVAEGERRYIALHNSIQAARNEFVCRDRWDLKNARKRILTIL
jgi:hypothetical protein